MQREMLIGDDTFILDSNQSARYANFQKGKKKLGALNRETP